MTSNNASIATNISLLNTPSSICSSIVTPNTRTISFKGGENIKAKPSLKSEKSIESNLPFIEIKKPFDNQSEKNDIDTNLFEDGLDDDLDVDILPPQLTTVIGSPINPGINVTNNSEKNIFDNHEIRKQDNFSQKKSEEEREPKSDILKGNEYSNGSKINEDLKIESPKNDEYDSDEILSPPILTSMVSYDGNSLGGNNFKASNDSSDIPQKNNHLSESKENYLSSSRNQIDRRENNSFPMNQNSIIESNGENSDIIMLRRSPLTIEDTFLFLNNSKNTNLNNNQYSNLQKNSTNSNMLEVKNDGHIFNHESSDNNSSFRRKNLPRSTENYRYHPIDETVLMDPALFADDMMNEDHPENESPLAGKNRLPIISSNKSNQINPISGSKPTSSQQILGDNQSKFGLLKNSYFPNDERNKGISSLSRVRSSEALSPLQPDRVVRKKTEENSTSSNGIFDNNINLRISNQNRRMISGSAGGSIITNNTSLSNSQDNNRENSETRPLSTLGFSLDSDPSIRLNSSFFSEIRSNDGNSNSEFALGLNSDFENSRNDQIVTDSRLSSTSNRPRSSIIESSMDSNNFLNGIGGNGFGYSPFSNDFSILSASTSSHADPSIDGTTSIYPDTVLLNLAASQAINNRQNASTFNDSTNNNN
ncbi:hypothetical protein AYI68_g7315 [Smittium mucronatum]|uniref:Uncharacterized protein n=1 Tax=Smittium mucronatum TaxID=133383 RepID=A0A1R0GP06_9FUNG|nr:hypothetical protein AYI68_g7315 [Smittium mucronatum]